MNSSTLARALSLALFCALAGGAAAETRIFAVEGGAEPMGAEAFAETVATLGVDIVVLGEVHDNAAHHRRQAEIVAAIEKRVGVVGLAFEMFGPEREATAAALRAEPSAPRMSDVEARAALAEALGWEGSGWPDFALYAPIFEAAPDAVVTGGAAPRDALMAFAGGDAAAAGLSLARFGLDEALTPAEQGLREKGQIAAHCDMLPAEAAPPMVAIQRLRDARFADAVIRALKDGRARRPARPNGVAVLITGTGHARSDWGAPAAIAYAEPRLSVISVGMIETAAPARDPSELSAAYWAGAVGGEAAGARPAPFDHLIAERPIERDDPCAVFRTRKAAE